MDINYMQAFSVIPRSLVSLLVLFIVTKLIGKKQVSELSLFDYVIGISIGNFAAEVTLNFDGQFLNGIVAVITFGIVATAVSLLTMKSMFLRRVIIGTPTMIIQNGKIIEKNMEKVKIDMNDLLEQIRVSGYFDLNEVEYAIMEANGKLSILPKATAKPITAKDMKIKVSPSVLCANIVIDGRLMTKNIENMNKTEDWIIQQLKVKGYKVEDILLATLDEMDKIVIYEKCQVKVRDVLE